MDYVFSAEVERLIKDHLAGGEYGSADELVLEALRALEEISTFRPNPESPPHREHRDPSARGILGGGATRPRRRPRRERRFRRSAPRPARSGPRLVDDAGTRFATRGSRSRGNQRRH